MPNQIQDRLLNKLKKDVKMNMCEKDVRMHERQHTNKRAPECRHYECILILLDSFELMNVASKSARVATEEEKTQKDKAYK